MHPQYNMRAISLQGSKSMIDMRSASGPARGASIIPIPAIQGREIPVAAVLVERCACCWSAAYPDQRYPLEWSSTLCTFHAAWTLQRRRARAK